MNKTISRRSGGQILVDALRIHGVKKAFCVPGESYLAVLDALHDVQEEIDLIVCRQEGGAAYMAEAYGKLTGEPGICFVTRGPGATNASVGVHTAFQDSSPMILFIGQVARDQQYREAFQEIDFRQMFGPLAKWVVQIDDTSRIPELISQAFHRAVNGRPGPVVVALPEDMLTEIAEVSDAGPFKRVVMAPANDQMVAMQRLLDKSERPLMVLGGSGWDAESVQDIRIFAEQQNIPVAASFRCQDLFDNRHPNYIGDLGFAASAQLSSAVKEADLLLVVGSRMGEVSTGGYTSLNIPVPAQTLIHIHQGIEELGRVYQPALAINSSMSTFAKSAAKIPSTTSQSKNEWTRSLNGYYRQNLEWSPSPGNVQMAEIIDWLNRRLPDDAILTNGAGNYAVWLQRFYQFRKYRTQLGPTNGSMGYGVPAAVAAKLTCPDRVVVSFSGDGCFLMNGQEIATAAQYGSNVIFVVINNGMYGTIRMHQERNYPGRVSGTDLHNPDFAALAQAYGLHGEVVTATSEFEPAFERCLEMSRPCLIEIRVDPEALTPRLSLTQIREQSSKI
ncbi:MULTISPECIES: thiamine pyrophosphate-binding protein [Pseudomonas]|jgi:acetolactate synthase-1/2/3 large subunit|uniref:Thiamine pyrophosphate-binding protein n=1 Tax=Pseudomonas lini TaxID=163011 RepID=A0A423I9Y3_9PSED|nr:MULTISPECIES: thiamine pyrophosphate-binding protein [Pseudomonas]RON22247.1 thiamine pyrophosphate-binding protein [Pseudomonas lini]